MRRQGRNKIVGVVLATGLLVSVAAAVVVGLLIVENRKEASELRSEPAGDTVTPASPAPKASPPGDVHREPATACGPLEGGPVADVAPLREGTRQEIGAARLSSCRGVEPRGRATINAGPAFFPDPLPAGMAGAKDGFEGRLKSRRQYQGGVRELRGLGQRAFVTGHGEGVEVIAYDGNLLMEVTVDLIEGQQAEVRLARQIVDTYLRT